MSIRPFILAASLSMGVISIAACDDGAPLVLPPAPAAAASVDWMQRTGTLIAAARMNPLAAGRVYAAVGVAQYRAARSAEPSSIPSEATYDARLGAVVGASVQVLSFLFPAAADSLGRMLNASASAEFARGVALGRKAGDDEIAFLKDDGFTRAWTGAAPTGAGMWTPVSNPPSGATLGSAKAYFLTSGSQFRPTPPAFGSAAFNADLNEVLQVSKTRTAEQTALAKQWDYAAGTTTAVGYWNKTALNYIAEKAVDELEATRILALMHAAVFDAQIACWDAKYHYWMARPYQANSEIATVLPPPNHPTFPSGHSCVSASAARVLQEFFPTHASELDKLVADAGLSRIYAGIHYRFDITAGAQLGKAVSELALAKGL